MGHVLILAGVILPLSLDTFAVSAALGMTGLPPDRRLRTSLVLTAFEAGMPIVGALAGSAVGQVVGRFAGWTAIAFLVIAGVLLLRPGNEEQEASRAKLLARAQGIAIIDLGISISIDELAIGFSIGLLGISLAAAVIWTAIQAFVATQLGMRVGNRVGEELREHAERAAGAILIFMALVLAVVRLTSGSL
jgi:putative Mn2+ efflux pump MntP